MNCLDRLLDRYPGLEPVLDVALATLIGLVFASLLFFGLSA